MAVDPTRSEVVLSQDGTALDERLRALVQNSWDILSILDAEGRLVYNSPAAERIHGFKPEDMLGRSTVDYIHPDDRDQVGRAMGWLLAHPGEPATVEYRYACSDGRWLWMEAVGVNFLSHPGVQGIVVNSRDISDRRGIEEELRTSEAMYRELLEHQGEGFGMVDETERFVFTNPVAETIFGVPPGGLLGRSLLDFLDETGQAKVRQETDQRMSGQVDTYELEIQRPSGERRTILVTASPRFRPEGGSPQVIGVFRDVTELVLAEAERQRVEAALKESLEFSERLLASQPLGVTVYHADSGRCVLANEAIARMLGATVAKLLTQNFREISSWKPSGLLELAESALLSDQEQALELQLKTSFGRNCWLKVFISIFQVGGERHLLMLCEDITEQKTAEEDRRRLEEHLAKTQRLESLGSLAGGLAHDMNNVLAAILGMASVHQEREPEGSALRSDMDTIVKACERGGAMVRGLLGFARQDLTDIRDVDLNALVRDQVALLSRTTLQRVRLEMDLAEPLPMVRGEASALSHALMNLCVNAVDAMSGGGQLTLRTALAEGDFVSLTVTDTGCGMSREVLAKALDPFFTTKPQGKGTGLGLATVYGTVKAHRGRLDLSSSPGEGTCVSLFLPAAWPDVQPVVPLNPEVGQNSSLDVLVVDDDGLVSTAVSSLLTAMGHIATVVDSGEEALAQLEAGLRVDLIILDLNMPGMGGAAALPIIRRLRPEVPVLLATGRVDQDALDLVQTIPRVSLMPKPFAMAELKKRLAPFSGR